MMNTLTRLILFTSTICIMFAAPITQGANATKPTLLKHERIIMINGFPALTYFRLGQRNKPLVVFLPGMSHLARIAYGSPKTNPKDFLAYWLHKHGYSFLAISYPLDNAVYSKTYPEFSITDWARQSGSIISQTINENHLSKHVVILAWSMAGAIARNLYIESAKNGFTIQAFIGLSAVPGNPYIMNAKFTSAIKKNKKNLIELRPLHIKWFMQGLAIQNNINGHGYIIPPNTYKPNYLGATPVNIIASIKRYQNGKFTNDTHAAIRDAGSFDYVNYPWIALITDDSETDIKINMVDPYNWYQIIANTMLIKFIKGNKKTLTTSDWKKTHTLFKEIPTSLTRTVHGSHFFFVGEYGAEATVTNIQELLTELKRYQSTIGATFTKPLQNNGRIRETEQQDNKAD